MRPQPVQVARSKTRAVAYDEAAPTSVQSLEPRDFLTRREAVRRYDVKVAARADSVRGALRLQFSRYDRRRSNDCLILPMNLQQFPERYNVFAAKLLAVLEVVGKASDPVRTETVENGLPHDSRPEYDDFIPCKQAYPP
jgi:hypothetical protein